MLIAMIVVMIARIMLSVSVVAATTVHNTKSTQATLQIIPTPLSTTPMTKVRPSTQLDITLVHIIGLAIGRLGAEWTFFDDDMSGGDAKVIAVGGEVGELLAEVGCDLLWG